MKAWTCKTCKHRYPAQWILGHLITKHSEYKQLKQEIK